MILITTAGKVGSEAARVLAEQGVDARVLVRDPGKAQALTDIGVDVVRGDLDDVTTIDAALRDVTSVVLVSPAVPSQELNVVDRAARAGVEHVVKVTSRATLDSPIPRQRGQLEIEAGLLAAGLSHSLLRNNFYMQNFLMLAPVIAANDAFRSSAGSGEVGFVDTRDVAAVAAAIAAAPGAHDGATYELTGPELLTYADAAAAFSRALGRPITFHAQSREDDAQAMVNAGVPRPVAEMNALAVSMIADGDAAWATDDVSRLLGRPARSFEEFAHDHAAAFAVPQTSS